MSPHVRERVWDAEPGSSGSVPSAAARANPLLALLWAGWQVRGVAASGFPSLGYRGRSGAVGLGYRFTVLADPATRPK